MKIIFAGTPQFAAAALEALHNSGHEIALVLTQPDKAAGRGMSTAASPVKALALKCSLPLLQPSTLKNCPEIETQLGALSADVMVVAAYGLILPQSILNIPRLGCINIHASLLPRWRGAAPIQRAILSGDSKTGITLMQMDAGLDTGDILVQNEMLIAENETSQTLFDKLALLGAQSIVRLLSTHPKHGFQGKKQDESNACYAAKLTKAEAGIDWTNDAERIERQVRGLNPFPGATCLVGDILLKIWQARIVRDITGEPGQVSATGKDGIQVACGRDALKLEIIQKPGGKKLPAAQFLSGFPMEPGTRLH